MTVWLIAAWHLVTRSKATVGKLFTELGPRYTDRPGGYIRILKCGERAGDKATMAYVELVGRPNAEADDTESAAVAGED